MCIRDSDINNWVHYYAYTFIIPIAQGKSIECVKDLSDLYALVMTCLLYTSENERPHNKKSFSMIDGCMVF